MAYQSYDCLSGQNNDILSRLNSQQDTYSDLCLIVDGISTSLKLIDSETIDYVQISVIEAIYFYCDIFFRKGLDTDFSLDQLLSYKQKGCLQIKHTFKNPKDLKDFFCKFPKIFKVIDDKVSLTNPEVLHNRRIKWIRTLLKKDHLVVNKSVINAIEFYSDILYEKKSNSSFPISQLVTHRNKAREDVQIIAITPVELKSFLTAYPQIFTVSEDKVNLTESAIYCRNDFKWLEKSIIKNKNKIPKEPSLRKAVEYYLQILYKGPEHQLSVFQLFKSRNLASQDIQQLSKNPEELKLFLSNYPLVFIINSKNKVKMNDSFKQHLINVAGVLSEEEWNKVLSKENISTKLSSQNNPDNLVFQQIQSKMQCLCQTEVPLQQLIKEIETGYTNEGELRDYILSHPDIFIVNGDKVILKQSDFKTQVNQQKLTRLSNLVNYNECSNGLIVNVIELCRKFLFESVGVNVSLPLEQLTSYINAVLPEIRQFSNNQEDFKTIISKYSNTLSVIGNEIRLLDGSENASINLSNENETVMFYLWVLQEKVGIGVEFPIARLKIYMALAPVQTGINNLFELRKFLSTFPDFFTVTNNSVVLKKSVCGNNVNAMKNIEKYNRYEKLYYVESYSTSEGIAFYSRILKRFSFNLEVPISHLFAYRSLAPVEVFGLAKDLTEFKKFLFIHPDIFNLREDNVSLAKRSEDSVINQNDSKEDMAIQFYTLILSKVSHNYELSIDRLFRYHYLAPPEVKDLVKTQLELKDFLIKYPSLFSVNKDIVMLQKPNNGFRNTLPSEVRSEGCGENYSAVHSLTSSVQYVNESVVSHQCNMFEVSLDNEVVSSGNVKLAVISTIRFYSNIMFKKGPNKEHPISNLISYRSDATNEVKEIAKKPKELLAFMSKFPQIFSVNSAKFTVMLADMITYYKNQRNWIKELLPRYHKSTTNHETVVSGIQFHTNIILEKGLHFEMPIRSLFSHRKTAMEDVQLLTKNLPELKNFLSMYPEIFIINAEDVALTKAVILEKIQPKWIEEIVGDCDFSFLEINFGKKTLNEIYPSDSRENDLKIEDNNNTKAIGYFTSLLETAGKLSISEMFVYRDLAPNEIKSLIRTPQELTDFFTKHSNVFLVKNDNIMLTNVNNLHSKRKKRQKQSSVKVVDTKEPEAIVKKSVCNINKVACKSETVSEDGNTDGLDLKIKTVNTILFYCNILCRKGPHLKHPISNIFGYQQQKSDDVKETFKNPKELKDFLTKFPKLFTVNNDELTVNIADLFEYQKNQRSWIKELLPKHHQFTSNYEEVASTIQFYSNILFEKSLDREFPFSYLFSHKTTASEEVKALTKNILQLKSFLSMFPEIFIVCNEGVSLTNSAILHKKQPKWIEHLVLYNESSIRCTANEVKKLTDQKNKINYEELAKKRTINLRRAIQFYYKIMLKNVSNNGFSLDELLDNLNEAPQDIKEIASNSNDLNAFLKKYPHIFTVNNGIVTLTSVCKK